jgi:hypothetical protein
MFMGRRPTNKEERLTLRPAYIPAGAVPVFEHANGSAAYTYERAGKLYAVTFWGTAAKPHSHYSFRNAAQRDAHLAEFKASIESSVAYKTEKRAKELAVPNPFVAGDVLYTSWGYDQTNIDFYVVTRVSGKAVYVRAIKQTTTETGFMCGDTKPVLPIEPVGEETRHNVRGGYLTIGRHHASKTAPEATHRSSWYA